MSIRTKFAVVVSKGRMMFLEKMSCDYCDSVAFLELSDWIEGSDVTVELMETYDIPVKSKLTVTEEMPNVIMWDDDPHFDECCDNCFDMEYTD